MNLLFEKMDTFFKRYGEKKIVIYGAGTVGKIFYSTIASIGGKVAYFVDGDKKKQGNFFLDCEVKSPYDLMYENLDEVVVLLGLSAQDEAIEVLQSMGLKENENYDRLDRIETDKATDVFDPFLGFSRMDDVEGFTFLGNENAEVTILALGGSTTDFSMSNLRSWPYFLQKEYEKKGLSCRVINGGIGGYYSAQEMLKLVRDGLYFKPDIVISFSGINDAFGGFSEMETPLISNYLKNTLNDLPIKNAKIGYGMKKDVTRAENWIRNMRIMYSVCTEFGIKFLCFLQPYIFSGTYKFEDMEKRFFTEMYSSEERNVAFDFYQTTKEEIKKYPYMQDLTGIFDNMMGIFYDSTHCNEEGNQIIAKRIYEVIQTEKERQ